MKKTAEELLQEQGLEQISVFDVLYPERVEKKSYLVIIDQKNEDSAMNGQNSDQISQISKKWRDKDAQ